MRADSLGWRTVELWLQTVQTRLGRRWLGGWGGGRDKGEGTDKTAPQSWLSVAAGGMQVGSQLCMTQPGMSDRSRDVSPLASDTTTSYPLPRSDRQTVA